MSITESVELVPYWEDAYRAVVRRSDKTVFACTVTPQESAPWFVTECLPQRRDHELSGWLLAVCDRLTAVHGAMATIAVHPAFLEAELTAAGAELLRRIVPMWLALDEDLLLLHSKALPGGYRFQPLDPAADTPDTLANLSPESHRAADRQVWHEALSGFCGTLIPEASFKVVHDSGPCAAIAITEYHGRPLVGHIVTESTRRGAGLGRALLVEGLRGLLSAGYTDCRLNVEEDNRIARRLYRSVGFIQDRQTLRVSVIRERPADAA
ncbi:GNAT family N-acetyltransferase [Nonomuraea sp. NPDC059007]|uniref:GNAT family N-acetyltransferase n=1 Tax=Nonomuraea sp. NPDC059007 TaxID=3346692 RepID=UPI0036CF493C